METQISIPVDVLYLKHVSQIQLGTQICVLIWGAHDRPGGYLLPPSWQLWRQEPVFTLGTCCWRGPRLHLRVFTVPPALQRWPGDWPILRARPKGKGGVILDAFNTHHSEWLESMRIDSTGRALRNFAAAYDLTQWTFPPGLWISSATLLTCWTYCWPLTETAFDYPITFIWEHLIIAWFMLMWVYPDRALPTTWDAPRLALQVGRLGWNAWVLCLLPSLDDLDDGATSVAEVIL